MHKILGVVGKGFVGTALVEGMRHAFPILGYDVQHGTFTATERGVEHFEGNKNWTVDPTEDPYKWLATSCDVIFICVPTPMDVNGSCDISIVEKVVSNLASKVPIGKDLVLVIKSTVVPGTTRSLNEKYSPTVQCVFNPEFLREATYIEDFTNQDRIIIGGPRPASTLIKDVYQHAYPDVPTIKTCETTAEMVKYLTNCFLATKVAFANEAALICEKLGIDYDKVVEYATRDDRLGKSHWAVPGPDGWRGFGGKCFPKDLNALIDLAKKLNVDPRIMQAAWETTLAVREEKDWEYIPGAVTQQKHPKQE